MERGTQHTLGRSVQVSGVALHSGLQTSVTLRPAPVGSGVRFRRVDLDGSPVIPGLVDCVHSSVMSTTLAVDGVRVGTVEHLMAALSAEGVDNVMVDVEGPELPVLDGSAALWVRALDSAGLTCQATPRRLLRVDHPVEVRDGPRFARFAPGPRLELDARISFDQPGIGDQQLRLVMAPGVFRRHLAWARTFGFIEQAHALRANGLGRGGGLDNVVLFGPKGPLDPAGLRAPDEPVRHKMLDVLGDLALAGAGLIGRITVVRPGHSLTRALVHRLLAEAQPGA